MQRVSIWSRLIDLIFPPTKDDRIVRTLTTDDVKGLTHAFTIPHGVALMEFRHSTVRALVHRAKYANDSRAIELLASALRAHLAHEREACTLVPVPLSPTRQRERGYNQSERIAVAAVAGTPHRVLSHLIIRMRETPPQTHLDRATRLTNLSGSCSVPVTARAEVAGGHFIIVDDVSTTGATFAEVRRALKQAGARRVRVIALAH